MVEFLKTCLNSIGLAALVVLGILIFWGLLYFSVKLVTFAVLEGIEAHKRFLNRKVNESGSKVQEAGRAEDQGPFRKEAGTKA